MKQFSVLIIGEIIIDIYSEGRILGYEQDSTAPIFLSDKQYSCLGGAGNVAANVAAAKIDTYICSIINSQYKKTTIDLLKEANISTKFILFDSVFPTSIKHRYYERESLILRVDEEKIIQTDIYKPLKKVLFHNIFQNILQFDCIIISDYYKGLLSDNDIARIVKLAKQRDIPVIIDPARKTIDRYHNATIIKLNKDELSYFTNTQLIDNKDVISVAFSLLKMIACEIIIVTCSNEGILYLDKTGNYLFKTNSKCLPVNVVGAGDSVTAYTAFCLLNELSMEKFLQVLSLVGELAISEMGTSHIAIENVLKRLSEEAVNDK